MERVILRHLSGSRSNEVEEFPILQFPEIIVGRDQSSTVRYDPERDDLVGRRHAKIILNAATPGDFKIVDLGSRNGTYVNGQRIFSETRIAPGDVVQFGPGGPQLQFDVEPRPPAGSPPTRLADQPAASATGVAVTREAYTSPSSAVRPQAPSLKPGIGKETVERMIAQTTATNRRGLILGGAALGAAGIIGGGLLYRRKPVIAAPVSVARTDLTASEIFAKNGSAVVLIEASWKLIDVESGRQIYHLYWDNRLSDRQPYIDGPERLPVFVQQGGILEPFLTDDDNQGKNRPIGSTQLASGFVVHQDGFILTNSHVAAAWRTYYKFPDAAGLLIDLDRKTTRALKASEFPSQWVPRSAKLVLVRSAMRDEPTRLAKRRGERDLQGRHDSLYVSFPDSSAQVPARLTRTSDRHDVALIKIDVTELHHVPVLDDEKKVVPGEPVVVLGYPVVSGIRYASIRSRDNLNAQSDVVVPGLTVSAGNVGKVMTDDPRRTDRRDVVYPWGECYQLTVNSAGAGNSGGPVFDMNGKVIGIFWATVRADVVVSLAIPIKYGTELRTVSKLAG